MRSIYLEKSRTLSQACLKYFKRFLKVAESARGTDLAYRARDNQRCDPGAKCAQVLRHRHYGSGGPELLLAPGAAFCRIAENAALYNYTETGVKSPGHVKKCQWKP